MLNSMYDEYFCIVKSQCSLERVLFTYINRFSYSEKYSDNLKKNAKKAKAQYSKERQYKRKINKKSLTSRRIWSVAIEGIPRKFIIFFL